MPVLEQGVYKVKSIYISNQGYANLTNPIELANELKVLSLSQTEFKRGGGVIKIKGNGFKQNARVVFENLDWGKLDLVTPDEITLNVPQWGRDKASYRVQVVDEKNQRYTCDKCLITINATETPVVTQNYYNTSWYQNAYFLTFRFTGVGLAGTETEKPKVSLQIYNDRENDIVNNITQIYEATAVDIRDSDIFADFDRVPAGVYRASIYYGNRLGYSLFNFGRFINITLHNASVEKTSSSYLGGSLLKISGWNFPNLEYWGGVWATKNKITVCEMGCEVVNSTRDTLQCRIPSLVTKQSQERYGLRKIEVIKPIAISSDSSVKDAGKLLSDGMLSTFYESKSFN